MYKFLALSTMIFATPCLLAMEGASLIPLERPADAVEWAYALVNSPGHMSTDKVIECFNALTDEYLPLFEEIKNEPLEDKIERLNNARKCSVDEARKLLLKTWADLLLQKGDPTAEEKQVFDESVTTCINLLGIVISSDDLPINIYHRALTSTQENLRKAHLLVPRLLSEIVKLKEEEVWWSVEHNQISDAFEAIPKPRQVVIESLLASGIDAPSQAILLLKKELFERARNALEEGLALDHQADNNASIMEEESSASRAEDDRQSSMHHMVLLILQRALLNNVPLEGQTGIEDDYKVRVAARQLASEEAVKGLESMHKRTVEAITSLMHLQGEYEAKCTELRQYKKWNVLLRARLRRLAKLTITHDDEQLLQDFDGTESSGHCVIA